MSKPTNNLPAAPTLKGEAAQSAKLSYVRHLCEQGTVTAALEGAGITLSQLRRFRAEDPEFATLEEQAQLFDDDRLRAQIRSMTDAGVVQVVTAAMKRLPEYNPARETNVNVSGTVKHIAELPESELDALIEAGAQLIEPEYEVIEDGES